MGTETAQRPEGVPHMAIRVTWLGHSCLLFETGGKHLLVDPFLTGNPKAAAKAETVPADLILISHGHGDHVGDAVAIAKRTGAKIVCNYEISLWLTHVQGLPSEQVVGMQHGGGCEFPGHRPRQADAGVPRLGVARRRNGGNPCGFLITFRRRHARL